MFMFSLISTNFSDLNYWINFGSAVVLLVLSTIFLLKYLKRIFITVFYFIVTPITITLLFFGYRDGYLAGLTLYAVATFLFIVTNIPDFRPLVGNPLKKDATFLGFPLKSKKGGRKHFKIYDRDAVFHELENAVDGLSKTKTGALITIERNTSLDEIMRNGAVINAAVNSPLLLSIFYKGTALHDGAVVIRDNMIVAASVYYTPSTKPLSGKVGSRHRAALGISEISDSVTIIVSEETGRISLAYKGLLQSVSRENFIRVLTDYMDMGLEE